MHLYTVRAAMQWELPKVYREGEKGSEDLEGRSVLFAAFRAFRVGWKKRPRERASPAFRFFLERTP